MRGSRLPRIVAWLARRTLLAYPPVFRRRMGAEVVSLVEELVAERRAESGRGRAVLLAVRLLGAMVRDAVLEWVSTATRRRPDLLSAPAAMRGDIGYGLRKLTKRPGLTAAAIASIGLAIGANSILFSAVDALLLEGLPVPESEELVRIFDRERSNLTGAFSWSEVEDLNERSETLAGVFGYARTQVGVRIGDRSELARAELVTGIAFEVLSVEPHRGRTFGPEADRPGGAAPVAVISHALWTRLGGGDEIVGATAELNGRPFTIIGVMEPDFRGTHFAVPSDLWIPTAARGRLDPDAPGLGDRGARWLGVMARTRDGISVSEADRDVDGVFRELSAIHPAHYGAVAAGDYTVLPERAGLINPSMPGAVTAAGLMAMALVGLVLLVACANVAAMLLARVTGRRREFGVRRALGATRGRLVMQVLVESALLVLPAAAVGLSLATASNDLFSGLVPPIGELAVDFGPDGRVVLFTLAVTALAVVAAGLLPALHGASFDLITPLEADGGRGTVGAGRGRDRLLNGLVVAQLAFSVIVLVTAGLFVRTLVWYESVDPGYATHDRLAVTVDVGLHDYEERRGRAFFVGLVEEARALPGVSAAALALGISDGRLRLEVSRPGTRTEAALTAGANVVGPGYFSTMGIPILEGRALEARDRADVRPVSVVNETLAARLWPDASPIGKRLSVRGMAEPVTVVGVVRDVKYVALAEAPRPYVYLSFDQNYEPRMTLLLRAESDPRTLVPPLRRLVSRLGSGLPLVGVTTVEEFVRQDRLLPRAVATLAVGVGALALLLSAIGLYAVLAFSVGRRRAEFGLRMALGATSADIVRSVFRKGVVLVLAGVGLGIIGAAGAAGWVAGLLFGVDPLDPVAFGAALVTACLVAAAALYMPARRAGTLSPLEALTGS